MYIVELNLSMKNNKLKVLCLNTVYYGLFASTVTNGQFPNCQS